MNFSPQQKDAMKAVNEWLYDRNQQVFRLFGYAGTGKTTLAKYIASRVDGKVLFGAFTGKAAKVLSDKGCYGASTIHSMIYMPKVSPKTGEVTFYLSDNSPVSEAALVVIDECSMVNEKIGKDLLSFGAKVLVLGDPFQLPPVKGAGFFTECEPDFMLDEVHRQAADSPILSLATDIRLGSFDPSKTRHAKNLSVITSDDLEPETVMDAGTLIVGRNKTRRLYNDRMRERLGFVDKFPMIGETLICLQNDKEKSIMNGSIWTVEAVGEIERGKRGKIINLEVREADGERAVSVAVYEHFFQGREGDLDWRDTRGLQRFDFGYAITCHKSQGSQWNDVVVFDESSVFADDADRWLYTAVTRAAEHLTLVVNKRAA